MLWDLHFHSTDSDGIHDNTHIIEQISSLDPTRQGIWAMTNHDCYSPGFVLPARDLGIKAIWATEISAHSDELDTSLHITCYTPILSDAIRRMIDGVLLGKAQKVAQQVTLLQSGWFPIEYDGLMRWANSLGYREIALSNAHITQYLFDPVRRNETLRVLADATQSNITNSSDFLHECLKESGEYSKIGSVTIESYEPELSDLIQLAQKQDIILSVAHPNFSFAPVYKRAWYNGSADERGEYFVDEIYPLLSELGIENYEINTMATPRQVEMIYKMATHLWWLITYGSDNHGKSKTDAKHGLLGKQNESLTQEMARPIRERLLEFLG